MDGRLWASVYCARKTLRAVELALAIQQIIRTSLAALTTSNFPAHITTESS